MPTVTLNGLKNCDSCKKAKKQLETAGWTVDFRDFKKTPPGADEIQLWLDAAGSDRLLNRRGTTWRKLSDAEKASAEGEGLLSLLALQSSLMKRPVLEAEGQIWVGFDAEVQAALLSS